VQTSILIAHAVVGWALCGATIDMARKITTLRDALVIHAVATPIIFAIVSSVYFGLFGGIRPATTAAIFVVIVVSLDALVIAPLIEKSFGMFHSFLGTWLPFALIFLATWLTGSLTAR
jgi:hypothetical protein